MVDIAVHVILSVNTQLFHAHRVIHRKFVVPSSFVCFRRIAASSLFTRQRKGHTVFTVVNSTSHNRAIWISVKETDQNFLANARQIHHAPALTGMHLRHTDPEAAVVVLLASTVPRKLNFDATIFVRVDFLASRPNHDCRLDAFDPHARQKRRTVGDFRRHALKLVLIDFFRMRCACKIVSAERCCVLHRSQHPLPAFFARVVVLFDFESTAR